MHNGEPSVVNGNGVAFAEDVHIPIILEVESGSTSVMDSTGHLRKKFNLVQVLLGKGKRCVLKEVL